MKTSIYFLAAMLFVSVSIQAQTLTKAQMTGWKAEGIQGKVKSVTYSTKKQLFFNTLGNMTKMISGDYTRVMNYTTQKLTKNSDKLRIVYGKNTRTIHDYYGSMNDGGYEEAYTFDKFGRVIRMDELEGYAPTAYIYTYNSDADKFPSKVTWSGGEGGVVWEGSYEYEYLSFDKAGNWTKRNVKLTTVSKESADYDEVKQEEIFSNVQSDTKNYVETAIYVYYP